MILFKLFFTFFKIGAFTFGGGYAMLPLIQAEVLANNWLEPESLVNFIAVSESTPGPFALNMATYIGRQLAGIPGAIFATLGVVLPSFIVILIVARFFEKFKNSKMVSGCMSGLRPAVIGLIGTALISVGKTAFFTNGIDRVNPLDFSFISLVAIFLIAVYLVFKKKLHPIYVILISAALGIVSGYLPQLF